MFNWLFGNRGKGLEEATKKSFDGVKNDINKVGTWIKHLDEQDKQLFDLVAHLKTEISTIKSDIAEIREAVAFVYYDEHNKQVSKKTPVLSKQAPVYPVVKPVQTAVQTGNFYDILHGLSSNERLLIFTLMNAGEEMKLSYEDLARLLGKERSTVRGQINAIKQKSEGLIHEVTESNGKKRVYVREEVRNKLLKYAKVRVSEGEKSPKKGKKRRKDEEIVESESFE